MFESCKDCKFYSIDMDTVGLCMNSSSGEFGRLVWPSKLACSSCEMLVEGNVQQLDDERKGLQKEII